VLQPAAEEFFFKKKLYKNKTTRHNNVVDKEMQVNLSSWLRDKCRHYKGKLQHKTMLHT